MLDSCCACCRFLEGEGAAADKRRNNRFKLIPSILKSSWVVKQAVGTTPVLLGNKLVTKYFRCAFGDIPHVWCISIMSV
jgi:Protein ENHANCED DISEASE RESISTANCE 2, C-terminal